MSYEMPFCPGNMLKILGKNTQSINDDGINWLLTPPPTFVIVQPIVVDGYDNFHLPKTKNELLHISFMSAAICNVIFAHAQV